MVERASICLRRLAGGRRSGIVGFSRFLANPRVTVEALLDGWGAELCEACAGRHVLAIQDTSEINFPTTKQRTRGLGAIGKGVGRGVLLHAMLGLDAETGAILGLALGRVWTRDGRVTVPHQDRPLSEKESERWLATPQAAKAVLSRAAIVTEVSDRESDIYEKWAQLPEPGFHILTRANADRSIAGGGKLSTAPLQPGGTASIDLRARPGRPARTAKLVTRFGRVLLKRPANLAKYKELAETVAVSLVEVREVDAPPGAEPILWRLSDHPCRRGCGDGLARDRLVSAALAYRARLPHPETARAATVGQPAGKRRAADQADRDRRPRRLHDHATRPGARRPVRTTGKDRLLAPRNRDPPRAPPRARRQDRAPEEPPSARITRLGRMDHRQARRVGRLSQIQTARPNYLPSRPRILQIRRPRMEAQKCVNRLALRRGFLWRAESENAAHPTGVQFSRKINQKHWLPGQNRAMAD